MIFIGISFPSQEWRNFFAFILGPSIVHKGKQSVDVSWCSDCSVYLTHPINAHVIGGKAAPTRNIKQNIL